jgi:hypothetical protein
VVPSCPLLLLSERSVAKLLLLLLLKLLAVALELRRSVRLSRGWRVNHTVLRWSTATTTFSGSWYDPLLLLLFLSRLTSLHGALLVNGGAGKVIVGQVKVMNQVVLQVNIEPLAIELGLLGIIVNMMPTVALETQQACGAWCPLTSGDHGMQRGTHPTPRGDLLAVLRYMMPTRPLHNLLVLCAV